MHTGSVSQSSWLSLLWPALDWHGRADASSLVCELRAGQEIYLRRPDAYRLVGCTATFEQVAELAREQERAETAIGYITQARSVPKLAAACRAVHRHFNWLQ